MSNHRKYDPDFKREAVRLVVEDGLGVREVERNLMFGVIKNNLPFNPAYNLKFD